MGDARAGGPTDVDPGGLVEGVRRKADDHSGEWGNPWFGSRREVTRGEYRVRVDEDAGHVGGESPGEPERIVRVAPDHD